MKTKTSANKRIIFFDELRGLAVLFMVFFHGVYDIVYVFGQDMPWFRGFVMQQILQPIDAGTFIFLAGFATRYTRSNIKRGVVTFGMGMVITLSTLLVMPEQLILFGILHGLGSYMILFGAWEGIRSRMPQGFRRQRKIPPLLGAVLCFLLFAFVYRINYGGLGFFRIELLTLPREWYQSSFGFLLGFPSPRFYSADYFPLLPWFPLFLSGSYVGRWTKEGTVPPFFYRSRCKPLAFVGRHSLIIYMVHQPLLYGILWLFFR